MIQDSEKKADPSPSPKQWSSHTYTTSSSINSNTCRGSTSYKPTGSLHNGGMKVVKIPYGYEWNKNHVRKYLHDDEYDIILVLILTSVGHPFFGGGRQRTGGGTRESCADIIFRRTGTARGSTPGTQQPFVCPRGVISNRSERFDGRATETNNMQVRVLLHQANYHTTTTVTVELLTVRRM